MDENCLILRTAAELAEAGEEFVLLTVIRTQGSTPRAPGARMIWRPSRAGTPPIESETLPNGSIGTIGGGQFEDLVLDSAKRCLASQTSVVERFVLGAEAEQCCGGVMEVFVEYYGRPASVVVFGAGHVAHALARLLEPMPLALTIVDDRPDWNSESRFPNSRRILNYDHGVTAAIRESASTVVLVMTCSHEKDFDVLRGLLSGSPPAFTGLIGSKSKRACIFGRLASAGIDESVVRRVQCPIGLGDSGKEPHAIAISVAAQVLSEIHRLRSADGPARHRARRE